MPAVRGGLSFLNGPSFSFGEDNMATPAQVNVDLYVDIGTVNTHVAAVLSPDGTAQVVIERTGDTTEEASKGAVA